jgi:Crp-like helix-turn-helix domain
VTDSGRPECPFLGAHNEQFLGDATCKRRTHSPRQITWLLVAQFTGEDCPSHHLHAFAKHPRGGAPDRSALQFHGEEIGPNFSAARYGKEDQAERVLQKVSRETLAEMIGTTRPHVNLFVNKFRNLGFIEYGYNGGIKVNKSLLTVVLHQ